MTDIDYDALDPGIRDVVRLLRQAGFDTTDSGDGFSKPDDEREFDVPHVVCKSLPRCMVHEADCLALLLDATWSIQATYDPRDGSALLLAIQA